MKLLAIDLDGTLLNSKGRVTEKVCASIKKIQQEGYKIVLASGRPFLGIQGIIQELELPSQDFCITNNGGCLQSNDGKRVLFQKSISLKTYQEISSYCDQEGVQLIAVDEKRAYLHQREANLETIRFCWHVKYPLHFQELQAFPINQRFFKMMVSDKPEKIIQLSKQLKENYCSNYEIFQSESVYLEVMPKNVSKGAALAYLMKYLGINSNQEVIAIGNNENDLSMIKIAGTGIAMENGTNELKSAATWVCKSNDCDGVSDAIQRIISDRVGYLKDSK